MSVSVYEMVTNKIIDEMNKGIIPWRKPWFGNSEGAISYHTRKPYSLLNQMMLSKDGEYLTFKQVADLKGKVKKGAKSEFVVFWKMQKVKQQDKDGNEKEVSIPLLRYYNVFHISDTEGIKSKTKVIGKNNKPIEEAEKIKNDYVTREGITINEIQSNRAFYSPILDSINVPVINQFEYVEEFYSTLFHEMVHSTMKENRCNREEDRKGKDTHFGSEEYSKEELVAEIGSANILTMIGIDTDKAFKNHVAYLQSWISVLKNDVRFIVSASSKAEKAVKYILNKQEQEQETV